jgi:hypothetical protein
MTQRRALLTLLISLVFSLSLSAQSLARPVLIKLDLKESGDWSAARSLGVVAYYRSESFVLAEFEKARLGELDQAGLKYQIVDESPWSEEYFLVSAPKTLAKPAPVFYGKVLFEDQARQFVKGSKEEAVHLAGVGYTVVPIRHRAIPLEYKPTLTRPPAAARYSEDIGDLVDMVSADSLHDWIQRLQNFQTRYSYSDSVIAARDWLYQKMSAFGIDSLWLHHYYEDSHQWNVVATVEGTVQPDRVMVVGGHYDSVVYGSGANPMVFAPGADDNASGTVVALELARIISQNPLPITVMFVPFAQEEQGLVGSDHFAEYLHNQGANVELMINSDMIGHSVDSDPDVIIHSASSGAMPFVQAMIDMADTYTDLRAWYDPSSYGSDQISFYQWGYDAVVAAEGEFHTAGWHTNYDLIDSLNFPYLRQVVQMCLATVLTLGSSPSAVTGLAAVDAGDGEAIYLHWSENDPVEDVDHYNLYFGTSSGDYDSLRQVAGSADTLTGLTENTTYFISVSAVNQNGFESAANPEVSLAPKVAPRAPSGLAANPYGRYKIELDWAANREADFDYYRVFRSEQSGSDYQLLADAWSDTTFVDSTVQGEVDYYYYTLTAVDTTGNESQMSSEAQGFAVTLDQGLLVVDETYLNIGNNMVNGDSINAFYQRALQGYTRAYVDHSCPTCPPYPQLRLPELGRYGVVIVHSEDFRGNRSLGADTDSTYSVLKKYLDYGGRVIIEGRRNLSQGDDGDWSVRHFSAGDVRYDRLHVESALVPPWSTLDERSEEFVGAHGQISGYPDLQVDSLRVAQVSGGLELLGRVPGVGYIDSLMTGEVIYTFHSSYDTSASEGKPVAFRYLGAGQQVIFLDFPLYFIQEAQATQLLHQALSDLGMSPSSVEEEEEGVISSFRLGHNFPNPFNAETIIEYSLPRAGSVRLTVYNILGQAVKVLVDETQTAGDKKVIWDGKNQRGQDVASGVYFYRMEAGEFAKTDKMLLLK